MSSRQSDLRVGPGSHGSALEPQAKVSRLLPGAPWPGLDARGFRCTAAGGDALLLRSSRGVSTIQLQVGPASFSPAPRPRLHPRGPAAGYWGFDTSPRPSARPPEAAGGRGQGRCLARPALFPRSPSWGGVTLQIFPAHLESERLPGQLRPQAARARVGCCRAGEADSSTPGRG